MLEAALAFAEHGVPIFPVRVYRVADRWRKEPRIKDWSARATTNPATIKAWWCEWPLAFVGVPLERVGLVVIDADRHGGPDGVAALSSIDLPPHQSVITMSNGEHHFFRQPAEHIRFVTWHGGQVLGDGRFVVAYALAPFIARAPVLPSDLLERLPKAQGNGAQKPHHAPALMVGDGRIPKALYSEVLRLVPLSATVTRHHQRRVIGILSTVTRRREGRNTALFKAAGFLREFIPEIISNDVAERLLFSAAQVCGYVAKDGAVAAMATIRSGFRPWPVVQRHGVV